MEPNLQRRSIVVVCPLEFERRALLRNLSTPHIQVDCCGPGPSGIQAWLQSINRTDRLVILAGLAGGLTRSAAPGSAFIIDEVIQSDGAARWRPDLSTAPAADGWPHCSITSTTGSLVTPVQKQELHKQTNASLVDLESVSFAQIAQELGWRWMIVRGVSDGPEESLPANIDRWVDGRGRVRQSVVLGTLLRRPHLAREMIHLGRRSATAMRAVANLLTAFVPDC